MNVNLKGTYLMSRFTTQHMQKRKILRALLLRLPLPELFPNLTRTMSSALKQTRNGLVRGKPQLEFKTELKPLEAYMQSNILNIIKI